MEQRRHARRFFDLACDGMGAGGAADAMAGWGTVSEKGLCNNALVKCFAVAQLGGPYIYIETRSCL
jgi:hypothetical protein